MLVNKMKQQEEEEARKKILQEAEETTKQIMEDRKRKELHQQQQSPSPSPSPSSSVASSIHKFSNTSSTSTPQPSPSAAPGVAGSGGAAGAGLGPTDRLNRAKTGIVAALKEIHTNLNVLVGAATSTTNSAEIMAQVKTLKAVKAELQKASEVVALKTYQYSNAAPANADRLSQIHGLLNQEAEMVKNLLNDIESGVSVIEQPTQLVMLVKLCKTVLGLVKS